ncbi:MAG: hypothetical protein IJJ26_05520 [Victivallales bacterium]|nr:hypothetical protein [Victivallales bacterium]
MMKRLFIYFTVLIICQLCLAQDDEKEYELLFQRWSEERATALQEWKSSLTMSSRGPNERTKSYDALVAKSAKLIPFLIKHIKEKRSQEEYRLYISLFSEILKIRFERKFLKEENRLLLTDYDIKYPSLLFFRKQGREDEFVYEYELWWDMGRKHTPEIFTKKIPGIFGSKKGGKCRDNGTQIRVASEYGHHHPSQHPGKDGGWRRESSADVRVLKRLQ